MSAYHPIYNSMGTKNFSDGNDWYSTSVTVNSIYDCIVNAGTGNGRPDSKEADKIYIKGENGLAPHSLFYAKDSEFGSDRGLTGLSSSDVMGEVYEVGTTTSAYNATSGYFSTDQLASESIYIGGETQVNTNKVVFVIGDNGSILRVRLLTVGISHQTDGKLFLWVLSANYGNRAEIDTKKKSTSDVDSVADINAMFPIGTKLTLVATEEKHPQLLTYGESLSVDMIGDPANYPAEWKSYLAGGGVTSVNPLLVDQNSRDLTVTSNTTVNSNPALQLNLKDKYKDGFSGVSFDGASYTLLSYTAYSSWTGANGQWNINRTSSVNSIDYENDLFVGNNSDGINILNYTSYNTPYTQIDPTTITKVNKIHEVVYSGDSHSVDSNNLVLNEVSGIIQTGNNEIVKSLPITAIDNATDVFDYVDDATNTTPTFIKFDATLADGGKAECIWGSADGVIDKTNVWARRY